jgi:hypothetical protein
MGHHHDVIANMRKAFADAESVGATTADADDAR